MSIYTVYDDVLIEALTERKSSLDKDYVVSIMDHQSQSIFSNRRVMDKNDNHMINCKICNSDNVHCIGKPRINKKFPRISDRDYRIFKCMNCRYYFIVPEIDLSQKEWRYLYEDSYFAEANITPWQKKLHDRERQYRLNIIQSKLKIKEGRFLDIGCGEGYVLKEAASHGFKPYGVDIADNLRVGHSSFIFFKGNIFEANYPDDFFSVIYMDSVLEHITSPMATLSELMRVLKPGGIFFVIVPNEDSLQNRFIEFCYTTTFQSRKYGKIKPFVSPYHVCGFNQFSLKSALKKCGFNNNRIEIAGFGGNYPFWRAYKFGTRRYFQTMLTYPIGLLSIIAGNQIQLMAIAVKSC